MDACKYSASRALPEMRSGKLTPEAVELFGTPCVNVPAYTGPKGLPIGVRIVGRYGADTQTLYWAHWVERALGLEET